MSANDPRRPPEPKPVPQSPPVGDVNAHIQRFMDMLADRGIADEGGPLGRDDGRL